MPGYTPDNDGTFDAEFKIAIPEMQSATRSFATPQIDNLWLFIFDSSGYISQALEVTSGITAESTDNTWEDNKATTFTVEGIAETSYSRTIHLIANLPEGTNTNGFFAESNFISSLKTSGTQDAYWQRVEMPNGITQATINALGVIPMVRNYAKVSAVSEVDKFSLTGLILTNVPNSGSVAPYHTNTLGLDSGVLALLNGNFANYRATDENGAYTDGATDYEALEKQEYNGFEPSGVTYSDQAVPTTWQTYQYLYERDHSQTEKRTYAIIQGTWNDGTTTKTTYYKVDIVKESGDAYNLLRNIEYRIVVENVTGWGFDSADDAIKSPAVSNNLDFNVETRDLLNVSDGTSRLFIEYSRKVITAGNSQITFRYRYVPDIKSPTVSHNVTGKNEDTGNDVTISWSDFASGVKLGDAVIADADTSTDDVDWVSNKEVTDSEGYIWNEVTFKVADVGDEAKIQEFTLSAKNEKTGATLSRVVELRLVKPFKFSIDVAPKVEDGAGKAVLTTLTLPKGLPKGIFPLTFNVVCGNGSLTSSLPVVTGLDINGVPKADGKYFGYAVTIDYDGYDSDNGTVLRPEFSTNMADAALAIGEQKSTDQKDAENNGTKVRAYNPYFEPDFSQFWIGSLYAMSFDNNTLTVEYGSGNSVEATLRINTTSIVDSDWSTDENQNQYLDIVFSDSNNSLTLSDVGVAPNVADNFGNALRIYRTGFEGGTYAFPLTFTTKKFVSATTITAYNEDFTPASATLTNKSFGQLGIEVTKGATLVPGAGQTVTVKVTVPDDAEAAFEGDKLELTLTTSAAYLAIPETSDSISVSDTTFKVVVPKSDYVDNGTREFTFTFTTTEGNTGGTRTITISHPYMDSASAQTKTDKLSFTAININGSTSQQTIHGSGQDVKVNVTLPNDIPEALFANGGLVLTLTATQNTLDADSGTSGSGTTFTKTVTYAEYIDNKVVTFDFTTNSNNYGTSWFLGTSAKTTSVTVTNPNFNDSTSISFKTKNETN